MPATNMGFGNMAGRPNIFSTFCSLLGFSCSRTNKARLKFLSSSFVTLFSSSYGLTIFKYRHIAKPYSLVASLTRVLKSNATFVHQNLSCTMKEKVARLSYSERVKIELLLSQKIKPSRIAVQLGRHKSFIGNELARLP